MSASVAVHMCEPASHGGGSNAERIASPSAGPSHSATAIARLSACNADGVVSSRVLFAKSNPVVSKTGSPVRH